MKYDYKTLREQLDTAIAYKKKRFDPRYKRNKGWYDGIYESTDLTNEPYSVNLAYSIIRTIVASIYARNVGWSALVRGSQIKVDGQNIPIIRDKVQQLLELAIKIYLKEMRQERTNRKIVTDASAFGYGVSKQGYKLRLRNSVKNKILSLIDGGDNKDLPSLLTDFGVNDEPFLDRINPNDMLFLPGQTLDNCWWQAQIVYKDSDEAQQLFKKKLPTMKVQNTLLSTVVDNKEEDKVKLYEIHILDPENPLIVTLCEGYGEIVLSKPHPMADDISGQVDNMFKYLYFNETIDGLYPQADLDIASPQIREANIQIERRVNAAKRMSPIIGLYGSWDDEQVDALKNGGDFTVIKNMEVNASAQTIQFNGMGQEFYENINMLRNEAMEVLGLSDYMMGGNTQERKATEAQIMAASSSSRVAERAGLVEEFVFSQIDLLIEIFRKYKMSERLFELVVDGQKETMAISSEFLSLLDIDIQIIPGSSISLNQEDEFRRAKMVVDTLAAIPNQFDSQAIVIDMLKKAGVVNPERYKLQAGGATFPQAGADGRTPAMPGQSASVGQPSETPMQGGNMPQVPQSQ